MGEYSRRFWQPVVLSRELAEPDGPPIRVKAKGEALLAFHGTQGRVGLIERRCAHRGEDLFFGHNEDCGLLCVHHGCKYDVSGKCVDMPNVPPGAKCSETIALTSYPTREFDDLVWAYLGPRDARGDPSQGDRSPERSDGGPPGLALPCAPRSGCAVGIASPPRAPSPSRRSPSAIG